VAILSANCAWSRGRGTGRVDARGPGLVASDRGPGAGRSRHHRSAFARHLGSPAPLPNGLPMSPHHEPGIPPRPDASSDAPWTVVDPVCGMVIDPATAAGPLDHAGVRGFFCCAHCLERFQADPSAYIKQTPVPVEPAMEADLPEAGGDRRVDGERGADSRRDGVGRQADRRDAQRDGEPGHARGASRSRDAPGPDRGDGRGGAAEPRADPAASRLRLGVVRRRRRPARGAAAQAWWAASRVARISSGKL